jgi:hypothetical protein
MPRYWANAYTWFRNLLIARRKIGGLLNFDQS